jgi:hypothetical protein
VLERVHDRLPDAEISRPGENPELVADDLVEHLVVQHGRDLVDRIGIARLDHRFALHVAEQRHLPLVVFRESADRYGRAGCPAGCRSRAAP